MTNNKYLSLEGLTQYDGLIKGCIKEQIDSIDTIEINDNTTSSEDTWSSKKISEEFSKITTVPSIDENGVLVF